MVQSPRLFLHSGRPIREPYVRATALAGFAEAVRASGGDPAAWAAEVGLAVEALERFDGLVSFARVYHLMDIAAERLGRPALGVEIAVDLADNFAVSGPLVHLASAVETFGDWIDAVLSYWRLHSNAAAFARLDDFGGDRVLLRLNFLYPERAPPRQYSERLLAFLILAMRRVSPEVQERDTIIRFQHEAPADLDYYRRAYQTGLEFSAEHTEIDLPRRYLDYKVNGDLKTLTFLDKSPCSSGSEPKPLTPPSESKH